MSINIEDRATCQLAEELAHLTGETVTAAITVALKERLERHRAYLERLEAIREFRRQRNGRILPNGPSATDHGDYLYAERGLPR